METSSAIKQQALALESALPAGPGQVAIQLVQLDNTVTIAKSSVAFAKTTKAAGISFFSPFLKSWKSTKFKKTEKVKLTELVKDAKLDSSRPCVLKFAISESGGTSVKRTVTVLLENAT